jgi:hypothetical protein
LEGAGWALNDRLILTRGLASLITRRPKLPRNARVDRTDVLRSVLVNVREDDEQERSSLGLWLGLTLGILFVVLWQLREPLVREACERQWMKGSTCDALQTPGASPTVPPPPAAPGP